MRISKKAVDDKNRMALVTNELLVDPKIGTGAEIISAVGAGLWDLNRKGLVVSRGSGRSASARWCAQTQFHAVSPSLIGKGFAHRSNALT